MYDGILSFVAVLAPANIFSIIYHSIDLKKKNIALHKLHQLIAPIKNNVKKANLQLFPTLDYLDSRSLYSWHSCFRILYLYKRNLSRKIDIMGFFLFPSFIILIFLSIYMLLNQNFDMQKSQGAATLTLEGVLRMFIAIILIFVRVYRGSSVNEWNHKARIELYLVKQAMSDIHQFASEYFSLENKTIKNILYRAMLIQLKLKYGGEKKSI